MTHCCCQYSCFDHCTYGRTPCVLRWVPRRQCMCSLKFIIWKRLNWSETCLIFSFSPGWIVSTPSASLVKVNVGSSSLRSSSIPCNVVARSRLILAVHFGCATGLLTIVNVVLIRSSHNDRTVGSALGGRSSGCGSAVRCIRCGLSLDRSDAGTVCDVAGK